MAFGALDNFDRVARGETGGHRGHPFFDGLVYETRLPELAIGVHPHFTERREAELLGDVGVIEADAGDGSRLTAVPFYARGNRGGGPDEFEVWVTQEGAVPDNRDGAPAWLYRPYR